MPDLKPLLQAALETELAAYLQRLAATKIPVPDKSGYTYCAEGTVSSLITVQGKITVASGLYEPDFAKSSRYLGDGIFDLNVALPACKCKTLRHVIQIVTSTFEDTLDFSFRVGPAELARAIVKFSIGPVSIHLRIYECPTGATRTVSVVIPAADEEAVLCVVASEGLIVTILPQSMADPLAAGQSERTPSRSGGRDA